MRADPGGSPDPEAELVRYAGLLADGVAVAVGPWVRRSVQLVAESWQEGLGDSLEPLIETAAAEASRDVGERVRDLLALDVSDQSSGPLAVLRSGVRYPTEVLRSAGVPPVVRDEFAERAFPEDLYGLVPASFADVSPDLHEPGLRWGAAKAFVILDRRRRRDPGP